MKKVLKRLISISNNLRFRNKAVFKGKVNMANLKAKISLGKGSKKEDIIIGDNSVILGKLISVNGGKIFLKGKNQIGRNTTIGAVNSIFIGLGTGISNDVVIMDNNNHPVNPEDRKIMRDSSVGSELRSWKYSSHKKIIIGDYVWIGQYARINKGVTIGNNSIVAANSVVTKDIPANCIVAGNPAKVVKTNIQNEPRLIPDNE